MYMPLQFIIFQVHPNLLSLHPLSFNKRHPIHFLSLGTEMYYILHLCMPKIHLHTLQDCDQFTIALTFRSDHIIYYHIDATWSVALALTYFAHPDYLYPDTIN